MKKAIALLLALAMITGIALAETDLSGMSFDQLVELERQCRMEKMSRKEWKQVRVPQGVWEVGKDIPAGTWVIRCASEGRDNVNMRICVFKWGTGYPKDEDFEYKKRQGRVVVADPGNRYHDQHESGTPEEVRVTLEDGQYVVIENHYNAAVFLRDFSSAPFTFD